MDLLSEHFATKLAVQRCHQADQQQLGGHWCWLTDVDLRVERHHADLFLGHATAAEVTAY